LQFAWWGPFAFFLIRLFVSFSILFACSRLNNSSGLDGIMESRGTDMVVRNMKVERYWGCNFGSEFEEQEGTVFQESFEEEDAVLSNFGRDDGERTSKMSGLWDSSGLPSELMSFALTYEKAYCSSVFMDYWTTERSLSRIEMPFRMKHRPKTKLQCLTWYVTKLDGT